MNNYRQIVSIALLITSVVLILTGGLIPVSYTHLDVYKRQTVDGCLYC